MKVLLSIKPEYAEKILNGSKCFEYRKSIFKNKEVKTVVIYATMPIGTVIGEFKVDGILQDEPDALWKKTHERSGITRDHFKRYFNGCKTATAIQVSAPKRYPRPLGLKEISGSDVAPQSFRYLR